VQRVAEDALAQTMAAAREVRNQAIRERFATYAAPAGSVVVLEATTGSVVAMASNPTYDPNRFADGIPSDLYEALNDPANHYPLVNRAIQGQYAPGSTFKAVTSVAGLRSGAISPGSTVHDEGCIDLEVEGGVFCNAGRQRHGYVDLPEALTVSSDVYFYTLGRRFWGNRRRGEPNGDAIQEEARRLGLGEPTGVALAGEAEGRVPDAAWKQAVHDERPDAFPYAEWLPGDNINLAVGQGDLLVTPLQLATAYQAIANGGTLFTPRLASHVQRTDGVVLREVAPRPKGDVGLPDGARDAILSGLRGAVTDDDGTATSVFSGFPFELVDVVGKTGTAEVTGKQDTSVFAAITPATPPPGQPQYVVVALVEEGGFGADTAAPIVRRVVEGLNNLPLTPIQVAGATSAD
jgi:penicillin-binding protein 2